MPKDELEILPNIGPVLARSLKLVDIKTIEDLQQTPYQEIFRRIRQQADSGACLAMLMGLVGAQKGLPKHLLDVTTKAEVKAFYKSLV